MRELEDMWESILGSPWSSLAVLPTDHGTPVDLVASAFDAVARRHSANAPRIIDAQGATVPQGENLSRELESNVMAGERAVVIVDSVMRSLAGIPLLRSVDAILLVVRVGVSDLDAIASTLAIVGGDRVIGSVAVPSDE